MNMYPIVITPEEFYDIAEMTHLVVFNEQRPKDMNRIDFAILIEGENHEPLGYGTYREIDSESVYMQYGGCFPNTQNTVKAWDVYVAAIDTLESKGFKRATTLIENTNIPMLKFAFKKDFRIIGVRLFEGKIYCELLKTFIKE